MPSSRTERLQELYLQMCRIRSTEEALGRLWHRGLVSGEMHLGLGEEAVVAGVVAHLVDGDALALDYRSTPALGGTETNKGVQCQLKTGRRP